jgi:hypothetical protein
MSDNLTPEDRELVRRIARSYDGESTLAIRAANRIVSLSDDIAAAREALESDDSRWDELRDDLAAQTKLAALADKAIEDIRETYDGVYPIATRVLADYAKAKGEIL